MTNIMHLRAGMPAAMPTCRETRTSLPKGKENVMVKKVLAAVVAVVSLASCEKPTSAVPQRLPTQARVMPAIRPVAVMVETPDASVEVIDAGVDTLVLQHDTPQVDHLARARTLESEADYKGALSEARRALYSNADDEETLKKVATLARKTKKLNLAAEAFGRLARIQTEDATASIQQARTLYDMKDFAGAIMAGREGILRDSENAEAHHIVGLSQLAINELPGAIASFERVVDIDPEHGWALNNLGLAYLRANENEKAVDVLTDAARLLPHVAYVHNNLGVSLERLRRHDEAKTAYQHAMDLSPKYVKARINVARMAKAAAAETPVEPDDTMIDMPHPMPENLE